MEKKLHIFVTGVTGKQGGAVARSLLNKGHKVRALTRRPDSKNATILRYKGVEIIKGDFNDKNFMEKNAYELDGIFIMSTPYENGVKEEIQQGKTIIDSAVKARVKHIVFTSVANADTKTGIPHFESKYQLEEYLSHIQIPYTIIAPVFFFDNFTSPFLLPGLKQGFFHQALPPDVPLQSISVNTIGEFVTHIFENRRFFDGKRINLAEDELNGLQYSKILTHVSGKTIRYAELPLSEAYKNNEDMAKMYDWFNSTGYNVDINTLKEKYPMIIWTDFAKWAKKQNWRMLLNGSK